MKKKTAKKKKTTGSKKKKRAIPVTEPIVEVIAETPAPESTEPAESSKSSEPKKRVRSTHKGAPMTYVPEDFRAAVKAARTAQNVTQGQLAKQVGTSQARICMLETGKMTRCVSTLYAAVAKALGIEA